MGHRFSSLRPSGIRRAFPSCLSVSIARSQPSSSAGLLPRQRLLQLSVLRLYPQPSPTQFWFLPPLASSPIWGPSPPLVHSPAPSHPLPLVLLFPVSSSLAHESLECRSSVSFWGVFHAPPERGDTGRVSLAPLHVGPGAPWQRLPDALPRLLLAHPLGSRNPVVSVPILVLELFNSVSHLLKKYVFSNLPSSVL